MHKPSSVLRLLLLIFLIGWLGVIAQPAEAQQTVTLSGRVTDSAGQAVSMRPSDLHRLPDWIWIAEQDTDGMGPIASRLRQGGICCRFGRQNGPLIAQKHMELTLSTNTTQNIVLETGVTLSGRVTGPGRTAVRSASVRRDRCRAGVSFGWTEAIRSLQPRGARRDLPD